MDSDRLLDEMEEAVRSGARLLEATTPPAPPRTFAAFQQTFDAVDGPVTARIRERLATIRPDAGFVDEFDADLGGGEQWIVDGADGIVQYLQGIPLWCVAATLVRDGLPVAAVLHNAVRGETYRAAEDRPTVRNGAPVRPSEKTDPGIALIGWSHPPFIADDAAATEAAGRSITSVLRSFGAVRNLGPTSWQVGDVASGRMDGFWLYGEDDANLLGAALVARRAGLVVTDATGADWAPGARSFVTASPAMHPALLAAVRAD